MKKYKIRTVNKDWQHGMWKNAVAIEEEKFNSELQNAINNPKPSTSVRKKKRSKTSR